MDGSHRRFSLSALLDFDRDGLALVIIATVVLGFVAMLRPDPSIFAPLAVFAPIFDAIGGKPGNLAGIDVLFGLGLVFFGLARLRRVLVLASRPSPTMVYADEPTPVRDPAQGYSIRERWHMAAEILTARRAPVRVRHMPAAPDAPTTTVTRAKDALGVLLLGPGESDDA